MVDNFSIAVSHILLALMLWRLYFRADLDTDGEATRTKSFLPGMTHKSAVNTKNSQDDSANA